MSILSLLREVNSLVESPANTSAGDRFLEAIRKQSLLKTNHYIESGTGLTMEFYKNGSVLSGQKFPTA
jgi:hypothetical protein